MIELVGDQLRAEKDDAGAQHHPAIVLNRRPCRLKTSCMSVEWRFLYAAAAL